MNLVPWKDSGGDLAPRLSHPLEQFRRRMDALFDHFFSGWPEDVGPEHPWDFDVRENTEEVLVRAELPGFETEDLDVRVSDDMLTINAERSQAGNGAQSYRRFARTISLPPGIDTASAQASYRSGVLEVHLPRAEGAKPKRIPVQGGR